MALAGFKLCLRNAFPCCESFRSSRYWFSSVILVDEGGWVVLLTTLVVFYAHCRNIPSRGSTEPFLVDPGLSSLLLHLLPCCSVV